MSSSLPGSLAHQTLPLCRPPSSLCAAGKQKRLKEAREEAEKEIANFKIELEREASQKAAVVRWPTWLDHWSPTPVVSLVLCRRTNHTVPSSPPSVAQRVMRTEVM